MPTCWRSTKDQPFRSFYLRVASANHLHLPEIPARPRDVIRLMRATLHISFGRCHVILK